MADRRVRVNLAGQNFGFSLPNLEAEDGAEETQSVLSQYFPELKLAFGTKTQRGGRLGRSSVSVTPELTLRQREAAVAGSAAPISTSVQQPAPTPTPTPTREKRIPTTEFGISSTYFGGEDYWRNIERGVTPQEIKEWAQSNPQLFRDQNVKGNEQGLYEQIMRGNVRVESALTSKPTSPTPTPAPAPTPSYAISSQLNIPRESPGFISAPTPSPSSSTRAPISAAYGQSSEFFGGEDVKAAEAAGYSPQEIFDYISRNENLLRGPNVKGAEGGLYETVRRAAGR